MGDYNQYQALKIEKRGKVAIVTLNRPEVLNAINGTMMRELDTIWDDLEEDEEVKAVVLTGAGRAFCAGGDFRQESINREERQTSPRLGHARHSVHKVMDARFPVIAAINGPCVGLGATFALFCDIVFIGESGRIGDPHTKNLGVVAGDGGSVIWPLLIGLHRAKEFLFTGDFVAGKEAERIGLANRCFPDDQLLPKAIEFAQRLADGPTLAIRGTKHALNQHLRQANLLAMDVGGAMEGLTFYSEDNKEAIRAFLAKEKPKYKGR